MFIQDQEIQVEEVVPKLEAIAKNGYDETDLRARRPGRRLWYNHEDHGPHQRGRVQAHRACDLRGTERIGDGVSGCVPGSSFAAGLHVGLLVGGLFVFPRPAVVRGGADRVAPCGIGEPFRVYATGKRRAQREAAARKNPKPIRATSPRKNRGRQAAQGRKARADPGCAAEGGVRCPSRSRRRSRLIPWKRKSRRLVRSRNPADSKPAEIAKPVAEPCRRNSRRRSPNRRRRFPVPRLRPRPPRPTKGRAGRSRQPAGEEESAGIPVRQDPGAARQEQEGRHREDGGRFQEGSIAGRQTGADQRQTFAR